MFAQLPLDIIREHIMPYIYRPQSDCLCSDIRSFVSTRDRLLDQYNCLYPANLHKIECLSNDIHTFFCTDSTGGRQKMKRLFLLQTGNFLDVLEFLTNLEKQPIRSEINIKLGILNTDERKKLEIFCQNNRT